MFTSFFPRPKWFFLSAVLWITLAIAFWHLGGEQVGRFIGLPAPAKDAPPIIGIQMFWSPGFLWFYLYFAAFLAAFTAFWQTVAPHPYWRWSILGSGLIIFSSFIDVQVSVATNNWRGPFFDMVQGAMAHTAPITLSQYYTPMTVLGVLFMFNVFTAVLNLYFVSHYIFRWRTAMNDFYAANWDRLRHVEGASQRVQEDTMRFANIVEGLATTAVTAVMTLIAFVPVLDKLSQKITVLPLVGAIPHSLVVAALVWSALGTLWLAVIGVKLPGLNFKNQRVEAAYRKELVFGEDHADRAEPITLRELYANVRKNYFTLYFHTLYFNIGRYFYLQIDNLFGDILLGPSIVAGKVTMGLWQQVLTAFSQVSSSFLYLVNSWSTIIELISIQKRLQAFEAVLYDKPLDAIEATPDAAV
jgi:peptide/bleomycin uptake transporter